MAFPENWNENSFRVWGLMVVVICATATWPGTSVRVVAMSGMAVPKKRPPGSVVSERS